MFCLKYIPHSDIVLKFQDVTTKVISSNIAKVNYSVTCILCKQLVTDGRLIEGLTNIYVILLNGFD